MRFRATRGATLWLAACLAVSVGAVAPAVEAAKWTGNKNTKAAKAKKKPKKVRRQNIDGVVVGGIASRANVASPIALTLDYSGASADQEEPAVFRMTVRNTSSEPVTLGFSTGQRFEFEVLRNGSVVWNWSNEKAFTQALNELTLAPGEEIVFSGEWDLLTNSDQLVAPGDYVLRAYVTTGLNGTEPSAERTITVSD